MVSAESLTEQWSPACLLYIPPDTHVQCNHILPEGIWSEIYWSTQTAVFHPLSGNTAQVHSNWSHVCSIVTDNAHDISNCKNHSYLVTIWASTWHPDCSQNFPTTSLLVLRFDYISQNFPYLAINWDRKETAAANKTIDMPHPWWLSLSNVPKHTNPGAVSLKLWWISVPPHTNPRAI